MANSNISKNTLSFKDCAPKFLVPKSNNIILATTTLITKEKVSLSLTPEIIERLDKARGDVNRSLFITRMVERLNLQK